MNVPKLRIALRRLGLAGSALTFGFIALGSIIAPEKIAAQYAYTVGTPDSFNEFHAVFTGFWLGLCAWMLTAARRWEDRRLGDLAGIAIGLQALARLLSILMHGTPAPSFTSAMVGELITAAVIVQGGGPIVSSKRDLTAPAASTRDILRGDPSRRGALSRAQRDSSTRNW